MNFKYPYAISLGSSCVARRFIDVYKLSKEYLFFDWIGSSMWAVNKLVESEFQGLDNFDDYVPLVIKPSDQKKIITHREFYLRFLHDFPPYIHSRGLTLNYQPEKEHMEKTIIKYKRRAERFIDIISTLKQILFVRFEEDQIDRIKYEKYAEEPKDELEQLFKLTSMIKVLNPLLDFQILFFSKTHLTKRYFDERVFVVGFKHNIDWHNCAKELPSLINQNKEFLAPILNQ